MPINESQLTKAAFHPTWHTEWTMQEGWNQHLPIWVPWRLVSTSSNMGPVKVGINIFQYGSCKYLLVADYCSNFLLIGVLNNTIATKHGKPTHVYRDKGRQFTFAEFPEFAKWYRFEVLHSKLRYPQLNGFMESMVMVMKQIMSKADQARKDAHLSMLAYQVTPNGPGKLSPFEAMTQHIFRALLPVSNTYLSD